MPERRCIIRWQTSNTAQIKLEGAESPIDCLIKDINYKGLQICLKARLPKDTHIKLKLVLNDEFSLEAEVWVAWHKSIDDINIYGFYFTRIKDSDKEKIYKFVYKYFPEQITRQWWGDLIEKKGGETMKDRRLFERFTAQFPIRFLAPDSNAEHQALTCDISAKGIGFISNEGLVAGTQLEMWIQIPDKGEPLYTRGQVVWSKISEPERYKTGVDLEKADLMGLSRCLRVK